MRNKAAAWLSKDELTWLDDTVARIERKLAAEVERAGDTIPYIAEGDTWTEDKAETDPCWWTNGFWPGMLWHLHRATGDERYASTAAAVEERMDAAFDSFDRLHHDVGFMWMPMSVAHARICDDARARSRAMHAATLLAGRYNPAGRFLRSWNKGYTGWVIVDSMMNLPLLFWASEESGDPRFADMALAHMETVMGHTVRADGSCNHIVELSPEDGSLVSVPQGQGYAPESSWTRGQSWAIYGFALAHRATGDARHLACAQRVANYVLAELGRYGYRVPSDFRAPLEPYVPDASAACCLACGLLELADQLPEAQRPLYREAAVRLLREVSAACCDWRPETDGLVAHSTVAYHLETSRDVKLVYADYYFVEAVMRLAGLSDPLWWA